MNNTRHGGGIAVDQRRKPEKLPRVGNFIKRLPVYTHALFRGGLIALTHIAKAVYIVVTGILVLVGINGFILTVDHLIHGAADKDGDRIAVFAQSLLPDQLALRGGAVQQICHLAGGELFGGISAHVIGGSAVAVRADILCGIAVPDRATIFTHNAALVASSGSYISRAPAAFHSTAAGVEACDAAGRAIAGVDITGIVAAANGGGASAGNAAAFVVAGDFTGIAAQLHSAGVDACDTANEV